MTASPTHHRQGDILFVKVEKAPAGAEHAPTKIVARGETTGHAHMVVGGGIMIAGKEMMFVVANDADTTEIRHEEHLPIRLEPGIWRVYHQRELDLLEGARQVRD